MARHSDLRVLISGGGIAGFTLAILLKERGYDPVVIEREPEIRTEGYMMDFFGTGWDVADRMGLVPQLRAIRYPIDGIHFVDADGDVAIRVPVERVSRALDHNYVYLRRPDLLFILYERARELGIDIRFDRTIEAISQREDHVAVTLNDGSSEKHSFIFGADGIHSNVRTLVFGPEEKFTRFLNGYVAAFHFPRQKFKIGRAFKLYEETNRAAWFYPLDENRIDATYMIRHDEIQIDRADQLKFVREQFKGAGWIAEQVLDAHESDEPVYFDGMTQIVMERWHDGRIALLGDACGSLTLLAGQGSHMAMAGAYVIASELDRHESHEDAFSAYQDLLKPHVQAKQKEAKRFSRIFIPSPSSRPWLRRLVLRLFVSPLLLPLLFRWMGARSALTGYRPSQTPSGGGFGKAT